MKIIKGRRSIFKKIHLIVAILQNRKKTDTRYNDTFFLYSSSKFMKGSPFKTHSKKENLRFQVAFPMDYSVKRVSNF